MNVLIGCERSGQVREAFRKLGHNAWSCDLVPADDNSPFHFQGDIYHVIQSGPRFDLLIAHPPCTYLCNAGMNWINRKPGRRELMAGAVQFAAWLIDNPLVPRVCVENPVGVLSRQVRKPDQVIQPWYFGDEANKPTCLWLKNLPPLMHSPERDLLFEKTHCSPGEFYQKANGDRLSKWSHKLSGRTPERARIASVTFPGIACAMAAQWGCLSATTNTPKES